MSEKPVEILLVEDDPNDVELTLHALKKYNVVNRIHVARDGVEALDYIFGTGPTAHREFKDMPKLVLLDLKLPKVDGLEVLRRLKGDPLTMRIPVVILTSSREESDLIASYDNGANSYITKPVDFQQFSEAVRQLEVYWLLLNEPPPLAG